MSAERANQLFNAALDVDPEERPAFLREACGDDDSLRREVESLLASYEEDRDFLERISPALAAASSEIESGTRLCVPPPRDSVSEVHPDEIGPYKILQKIGQGGMGAVYVAEQREPVRRKVALKVIKWGMDTKEVLARFESEYHALSIMNHSHIAHVYDAGATSEGRPYFVMEYVPGDPLTEYCDRERLTMKERLELFIAICEAIQHAHQKGIIHRDLKPANILVTRQGEKAVPKIIDFGVAKATAQRLTERTVYTELGQIIGTPAYMSPEQAQMTGVDIDTRTDVYALGVILYELLTGTLPFDPKSLFEAGYAEMQRVIREVEPPKPSTRLHASEKDSATAARNRRTDRRSLTKRLRGDLDWITVKALEKNRDRRYRSASEFGEDIRRHLDDDPVVAGPPGVAYRLKKFVRKNRGLVTAVAVVLLTLVGGLVTSTALYLQVDEEKERADAKTKEALALAERERSALEEILRLSDLKRLADARTDAKDLWPAHPEKIDDLKTWLADRAERLRDNLPKHQGTLETLRREALDYDPEQQRTDQETHPRAAELKEKKERLPTFREELTRTKAEESEDEASKSEAVSALTNTIREVEASIVELEELVRERRTWTFDDDERQWQHDLLSGLVKDLEAFVRDDPKVGTIANVENRLAFARSIEERSRTGREAAKAWREATADIQTSEVYRGIRLEPQLGLLPLRQDPRSELWEFWHIQTGAKPEPNPDPDAPNPWILTDDTGLIFVLIPGGTFRMGAERPRLGIAAHENPEGLRVTQVEAGSLAEEMGFKKDDLLKTLNAEKLSDIAALSETMAEFSAGTTLTASVDRGGKAIDLHGTVTLVRGAPNVDPQAFSHESPVHEVKLSPFFLSKYEMTQGQWERFTGENPSYNTPSEPLRGKATLLHPVESVSWLECTRELQKLALRLPTEAQWEYATRAGTSSVWFTGDDERSLEGVANLRPSNWSWSDYDDGYDGTAPVGTYRANPFGLHDVLGNVWEWCQDSGFYGIPVEPGTGERYEPGHPSRAVRGGGMVNTAFQARSAFRKKESPQDRSGGHGVRPARGVTSG